MRYVLIFLPWFRLHEAGHYLAARIFGHELTFYYNVGMLWGRIPIPRYSWQMPRGLTDRQEDFIFKAGFRLELLAALPLALWRPWWGAAYLAGAILHRALYTSYGGNPREIR